MAQEYIYLQESNQNGVLGLNADVFKEIIKISTKHVEGCFLSRKDYESIKVKLNKDILTVEVEIRIKHGLNINRTCEKLQNKIFLNIFQTTEIKPSDINIKVVGFIYDDQK